MKQFNFHRQISPLFLLLTLLVLITGCATVREQTIVPPYPGLYTGAALPGEGETIFDREAADDFIFDTSQPEQTDTCSGTAGREAPYYGPAGWRYTPYYGYGRSFDPFDPYYCDPFLGGPFCSYYNSMHAPYWYYYNAYSYPFFSGYPYYYYPYYGYYYDTDDDHHHKRGFWHSLKHQADESKDARDNRVRGWREEKKDRWDEIEHAIRDQRDARMEQWQGIRDRARDQRGERIEQRQDFRGRVQDRVREMGEERRERWDNFSNNAGNAFSRIGEQRQERIEQRRDFFKEHGLFRNDNHQPLVNRGDNNNGSGSGLFNGGLLRGWGGRR
jgi:hypothetical protein